MNSSEPSVSIRDVQHFAYCPHRWGLIRIGCDWSENVFVNKAKLLHGRADSGTSVSLRGKYIEHSVRVYNDEWDLFGVLDCLQFERDAHGIEIPKYGGKFRLTIVEYKPSRPKRESASFADRMQLLAQKLCADSVFQTDCAVCFYYGDIRKRVPVSFTAEDEDALKAIVREIRTCTESGAIPPVPKKQYCSGCSMKDICLPKIGERNA